VLPLHQPAKEFANGRVLLQQLLQVRPGEPGQSETVGGGSTDGHTIASSEFNEPKVS
jgi:hypothetical protein